MKAHISVIKANLLEANGYVTPWIYPQRHKDNLFEK